MQQNRAHRATDDWTFANVATAVGMTASAVVFITGCVWFASNYAGKIEANTKAIQAMQADSVSRRASELANTETLIRIDERLKVVQEAVQMLQNSNLPKRQP